LRFVTDKLQQPALAGAVAEPLQSLDDRTGTGKNAVAVTGPQRHAHRRAGHQRPAHTGPPAFVVKSEQDSKALLGNAVDASEIEDQRRPEGTK
jgi:hypothetical protein